MATYFWVGSSGTWDNSSKTNWATVSGGAGGSGPPTSADSVNFDANSGTGTCTTAATAAANDIVFNSANLALTLGANLTLTTTLTHSQGTISLAGFTLTCTRCVSATTNTRIINFSTGKIVLTSNSATLWSWGTLAGFSYAGTPTVEASYAGSTGTRTFFHGNTSGATEGNAISLDITAGADIVAYRGSFKNFVFSGFTGTIAATVQGTYIYGNWTLKAGMTFTGSASGYILAATSGTQNITTAGVTINEPILQTSAGATVKLLDNLNTGASRSYTLTSGILNLNNNNLTANAFLSSNANIRTITSGTGQFFATGNSTTVFNIGNDSNLTLTTAPTVNANYSGATGTRTITGGGTTTSATPLNVNVTAGSDIVALTSAASYGSLNFTGFAGTLSNVAVAIYGNVTVASGMTLTAGANAWTFSATSGTRQITTAGKTLDFPLTFNGAGGTFAFQSALTQGSTRAFTFTNGTIQLKNGVTSTVGALATSGTNQKFLESTLAGSQATLSRASGTVNATYTTIKDINAAGGATWNALWSNNNVDAGNNTGWFFGDPPITLAAEYTYALRSFTQPRRF